MTEDSIRKLQRARRQLRELFHNCFVCPFCNYKWKMRKPHNVYFPPSKCPNCKRRIKAVEVENGNVRTSGYARMIQELSEICVLKIAKLERESKGESVSFRELEKEVYGKVSIFEDKIIVSIVLKGIIIERLKTGLARLNRELLNSYKCSFCKERKADMKIGEQMLFACNRCWENLEEAVFEVHRKWRTDKQLTAYIECVLRIKSGDNEVSFAIGDLEEFPAWFEKLDVWNEEERSIISDFKRALWRRQLSFWLAELATIRAIPL